MKTSTILRMCPTLSLLFNTSFANHTDCIYTHTYTLLNLLYCLSTELISTLSDVSITGTTSTDTTIKVNIGTSGNERVIIGYHRLDLGVPVVGEYVNHGMGPSRTFSSLVPGAKYRITAWKLGGSDDRRRSQSPAVREVTTMEQSELMYRNTHVM